MGGAGVGREGAPLLGRVRRRLERRGGRGRRGARRHARRRRQLARPLDQVGAGLHVGRVRGRRQIAVAVGLGGFIYRSADGGDTWASVENLQRTDLLSVFFSDERHGWVTGDEGQVLSTGNGGETWFPVSVKTRPRLTAVHFADETTGWAAGRDGLILRTDDGGVEWRRLTEAGETTSPTSTSSTPSAAGRSARADASSTPARAASAGRSDSRGRPRGCSGLLRGRSARLRRRREGDAAADHERRAHVVAVPTDADEDLFGVRLFDAKRAWRSARAGGF